MRCKNQIAITEQKNLRVVSTLHPHTKPKGGGWVLQNRNLQQNNTLQSLTTTPEAQLQLKPTKTTQF